MAGVRSNYRLFLTDHSIEEIRTILRRLSQTAEGAFLSLLFFILSACVWAYQQISSYAADSASSLVPLQDTVPSLFRRSQGFVSQREDSESVSVPVVLEHVGGTCQYDFHLGLRLTSSARLRVSDGARRTCFDCWHARVSTVEQPSEGNPAYHDTTMSQSAGETRTPRSWMDC